MALINELNVVADDDAVVEALGVPVTETGECVCERECLRENACVCVWKRE